MAWRTEGFEQMTERANTEAASSLENAGDSLLWVLRSTEEAVAALISGFRGLTQDVDHVTELAGEIVDRMESEHVSEVLPSAQALGQIAKRFVADRLRATSGILDTVTQEMALLQQLSLVTEGQAKIALEIKVLNVHTKVEVAHLGEVGAGFEYFARELGDFSRALEENTEELTRHTESRKAAIQKTESLLSVELPRLREELTQVEVKLCGDLAVLDSGLSNLAESPAQFKHSTKDIAGRIAGVVVAVQEHDITRQQIEHVQEAVVRLSREKLQDKKDGHELGRAYAGLKIQAYQLKAAKATITGWTSQIKNCVEGILRISASGLVGIAPLVLEQEQSVASQLCRIDLVERQYRDYGEKIRASLEGMSSLSKIVTEHLQKSASARNRLRFLTFNSVIEASHLGSQADTICVIADGISEVAERWNEVAERSSDALQEIAGLSGRVNDVVTSFAESDTRELMDAMLKTREGLEGLRAAAECAISQGRKIEICVEAMRRRVFEIDQKLEVLDACFERIEKVLSAIETVKKQLENLEPDIGNLYEAREIERLFSPSYTTETERKVMHAAIYAEELPAIAQSASGNDVELF